MCNCPSILEYCVMFSGVKLSIRSFNLFRRVVQEELLNQFLTLALNTLILSIFYISLDLSTIYFTHFSGC